MKKLFGREPGWGASPGRSQRRRARRPTWGWSAWWLLALVGFPQALRGASVALPLELRATYQNQTWINYQAVNGVPISRTNGVPRGSNGQLPTGNESTGVFTPPTPGQFRGFASFGGMFGLKESDWRSVSNSTVLRAGTNAFSGAVAIEMRLPRAMVNDQPVMILRNAQVGAAFLNRRISLAFGAVVAPPDSDERGVLLSGIPSGEFWLPEPYSTNGHQVDGYYWSPHSRRIYAIQPGPLKITWRKATSYSASRPPPTNYVNVNGTRSFQTNGANIFLLYTANYIVSGSAIKPTRKMYWTEKSFQSLGVPIQVPSARVGAFNIVYNNNFPRTVPPGDEFNGIGHTTPTEGTTNSALQELRTFWYDEQLGAAFAYNLEGRVFVELLGDRRPDGETHEPLGVEIVDVLKQAVPSDVDVELGERVIPPDGGALEELYPSPLPQGQGDGFAYRRALAGAPRPELYAIRETQNLNDYLVHWLEEGEAGLRWPRLLGRYRFAWPTDPAKYSHYVRPLAATEEEAAQTAIVLKPENAPNIEYQDPLDQPRAKFTSDFRFYSWLDARYPVHRTLLRYVADDRIAFERVFSWLDANLRTTNFVGGAIAPVAQNIVTNLTAWNASTRRFEWSAEFARNAPRVVERDVEVGNRLSVPAEAFPASGAAYLAGHIHRPSGTAYDVTAYVDPLDAGFEAANRGAIIPVNARPGADRLEVWWFRANAPAAGLNAGNTALGFSTVYWPSVIGRYQVRWPTAAREIVLASRLGGTGLTPAESQGTIYYQNDPTLDGYNPNEEHAIFSGGTPFATRDDLNITTSTNGEYSSAPYVLVDYRHTDGRPAMAVFKVLREKPEAGWVFDYIVPAGQRLEPPPPLAFLGKPIEGSGDAALNYNTEPTGKTGDFPGGWNGAAALGKFGHYSRFTYRDRNHEYWVYRGPHAGLPALESGRYDSATESFQPVTNATAVVGLEFRLAVHASRQSEYLRLQAAGAPEWLRVEGLQLRGTPGNNDVGTVSLQLVVSDLYDLTRSTNTVSLRILASGVSVGQPPLALLSTNTATGSVIEFTNRPPFLARSPKSTNSFSLRYYYRTEPSFAWPGMVSPPPSGSIVPYLRPFDTVTRRYVGAPESKLTESLAIVYRPVWPVRDPKDGSRPIAVLPYGATVAEPAFGMPGVRDFKTARVLYQQSVAANLGRNQESVVLHDPTRAKYVEIATQFADQLPGGIKTEVNQGKVYFPDLPPHLVQRVFIDPNRGPLGSLVLVGEYRKETLGESYLLLNVLRGSDLAAVQALCPTADTANYPKWVALVNALETTVESFREDVPDRPGTYVPDVSLEARVGAGQLAVVENDNTAVDSFALSATGPGSGYVTLLEAGGTAFTKPGDPVALHVFRVGGSLNRGELKILPAPNPLSEQVTLQHTPDFAGRFDEYEYEWKIAAPVDGLPPVIDATMSRYLALTSVSTNLARYTLGGAGVRALGDNYIVMRYRPVNPAHPLYKQTPTDADWSAWTAPALAEGWIKRVLAGINPFNQRLQDLFNNRVNTDVSLLTQAGRRWEGDVALNAESMNHFGLIEIYETVLRRGRSLSIESGFNYGPANDALLLAAGYLSDLYMMLGNEAVADALNPTIGIGTANHTYGDIATALFAFKGQTASLLEEELALLRGRDDVLQPGVEVSPVYNRLVWNYTRGIDAGEVVYAVNYNIQEDPNQSPDGTIDAGDAARMYPQGHGDGYGHYLTALKGYYSLLLNAQFDWVPRIEAVNVLGKPVSVDYQDERKFAAAAAARARTGRQVFELTWRNDYQPVRKVGWEHFANSRVNEQRSYDSPAGLQHPTRYWGMDHWASRVGQGSYFDWVVGNAILPDVDPETTHEGIQKVDRTTVPELRELATTANGLQTALDNAEGGLSPLGMPEDGMALDLEPNALLGAHGETHFEQIYGRAKQTLQNAVSAFDDAKDVTRLMRSEQDSLADLQNAVARQEQAYQVALVELYGSPYPDDMGPGRLYSQSYQGPDLVHYKYVDLPEAQLPELWSTTAAVSWTINVQDLPTDWVTRHGTDLNLRAVTNLTFNIGPHGFAEKPSNWRSQRRYPGKIQQGISELILAHAKLRHLINDAAGGFTDVQKALDVLRADQRSYQHIRDVQSGLLVADEVLEKTQFANDLFSKYQESIKRDIQFATDAMSEAIPGSFVVGLASGGDLTSAARSAVEMAGYSVVSTLDKVSLARYTVVNALELAVNTARRQAEFHDIAPAERERELRAAVLELGNQLGEAQERLWTLNETLRDYDDKKRAVRALIASGDNLQAEREIYRQRSSAIVQGYRTRDAAFRIFRNEKLERYQTLFDLAARYALLTANAFDYETGLLDSPAGRTFVQRIINSRALGVVRAGEPQFAGSDVGDPGLSSALAELKADWDVLRGRLGFNNPDAYDTTASLRTEWQRIVPGDNGDADWRDALHRARTDNLLADPDVRRYCLQIDPGNGLPVPGIILTFSTTITDGLNLFGRPLSPGDHAFSPSAFATKVYAVGVALDGYRGMADPKPLGPVTGGDDGTPEEGWSFIDSDALSATPFVYLIPVGVDSMRSPPLGDRSEIRTWAVEDLAIPTPFNLGGSDFAQKALYQSRDSLSEPLFGLRKHQAFRPVSSPAFFDSALYTSTGGLQRSQYTNNRLVGRSVWNSQWKLVIPGRTLLSNPDLGLDRLIATVKDIQLHFVTYSYSGN